MAHGNAADPARPSPLSRPLVAANVLGSLVSMGSALAGLLDPGIVLAAGSAVTGGVHLYAAAYAARALPLGAVLIHQVLAGRSGRALVPLLAVAGAVQVGDAVIGLAAHNPGMVIGAGLLAVLHLGSALRAAGSAGAAAPRPSAAPAGGVR
ncbi:hypothetical protein [Kitasatospora sp. NPDC059571]|uniref:hypothetical protein n=1 Tax=Kitasatospora sp. NPDC059571 TaxID=3346871 RepID=UPI0036CB898D